MLGATAACNFWTSEPPKLLRDCGVLCVVAEKCASRHSDAFLRIRSGNIGPAMMFFVQFDLQMCFAPQPRAIFEHQNFKTAPSVWCFVHFDWKMSFAPQRRAIFHLSAEQLPPHPPL